MNQQTKFTADDVKIIDQQVAYQGYFRIVKLTVTHRLYSGEWCTPCIREVFERGHAVGVLLYDPLLNKIVLIEQFRVGTLGQTNQPWLLEIVAGIIDPDEQTADVARRETVEETGLTLLQLAPICNYWVSPGGTTEKVTLYCAQVDASQAGGIHGLSDEAEDIRVLVLNPSEVFTLLEQGRICNAATIIAVQWFQLHGEKLKEKWLTK